MTDRNVDGSIKGTLLLMLELIRAYPGRSLVLVFCLLGSSAVEGLSIAMFLPLIEVAAEGIAQTEPTAFTIAVRRGLEAVGLPATLPILLCVIVIGMTLKAVFRWLAMRQAGYTIAAVGTDLRLSLIGALLRARWGYFASRPVGHFANAIGTEARVAANTYRYTALCLAALIQFGVYMAIAILVAWQTALMAMVAGALVMVILSRLIDLSRRAGKRQTAFLKALSGRLVDALHGIKPIKAMGREGDLLPLLQSETRGLHEAQRLKVVATETLTTFQEPLMALILAIGIYVVLTYFEVSAPALLMQVFLFSRLVYQINGLFRNVQAMSAGEAAYRSLTGGIRQAEQQHEVHPGTRKVDGLRDAVSFDGVTFGFGAEPLLDDVSLWIPRGRLVAVIGPSGSGKTTLADLVIGLFQPQSGEIRVDDVPLEHLDMGQWRRQVGYVPQEMFLFHDSVTNNVTLGDATVEADHVEKALRAAGAWDFVSRLPEGVDSIVGERGSRLSGGQRQRIAIARALVGDPALLILDEVTSSLDPVTEAALCETLAQLKGTVTVLAISHQPAITAVADIVYRLEGGRMTEARPDGQEEPAGGKS